MAAAVKWLLNELSDIRVLADSAKTAEKARVVTITAEAGKRFQKCYESYCYMVTAVHTQKRRFHDHPELVVTIGEVAFVTGFASIAREVVQAFFDEQPQQDQFYCRAKMLFGLIVDFEAANAKGIASVKARKEAMVHVMGSLEVATNAELNGARYNFLVFNTSLVAWQILSPFLRVSRASSFVSEMSKISAALEKVDDVDKNWRIKYLAGAALCYEDSKQVKEASDLIDKAIALAESMLIATKGREAGILEEVKASNANADTIMSAIRALQEREELLLKPPKIDPDMPDGQQEVKLPELAPLGGLAARGHDALKEDLNRSSVVKAAADERLRVVSEVKAGEEDVVCRLYMQRVNCNPTDAKKVQGLPLTLSSVRIKTLVTLQCVVCGAIAEKDVEVALQTAKKELFEAPQSNIVVETILDMCRVAWKLKMDALALDCNEKAEKTSAVSPVIRVKLDLCKAIRIVSDAMKQSANKETGQRLSDMQVEGFNVSRRIEAMKLLERTLSMATTRLEDESLVEEICVAIWNTGLTMLTPHLRTNVHTGFSLAAAALNASSSSLTNLRALFHFELAKCEEQADFVVKAKVEGERAASSDYGTLDPALSAQSDPSAGLDRNRAFDHIIKPFVETLQLRSNLYGFPEDVESQVLLNLQQIKESTSRQFQEDMLVSAADLILQQLETSAQESKEAAVKSPLSTEDIAAVVNKPRGANFTSFSESIQRRVIIMTQLAQTAHGQRNVRVLQRCARYVLQFAFDPVDKFMRHLIDRQIDMHFLLADSLVERLAGLWIEPEQEKAMAEDDEKALQESNDVPEIPNPRTLGIKSKYCSVEMNECKRLVVLCLSKGIELSSKIGDEFGVQNGVIYFWNLHVASFRHELFKVVSDDVYNFMKVCLSTMDALPQVPSSIGKPSQIDGRLKVAIVNNLALLHEARGELPQGVDVANKGAADAKSSVYNRRKLCETGNRLAVLASAAGAGGKGGKAPDPPKYDHPLLNVYALLAHIELPREIVSKEAAQSVIDRAVDLMKSDLQTWLKTQNFDAMSQESFDEITEMQAECWTRLVRGKILLGDVHGSQDMADRCMQLVAEDNMKKSDEKKLSPRVWRWLSVCERYFGVAIQRILDPVGMDEALLNELNLACLRHLCIACKYALRANMEELVVEAAISAWNASMHMVAAATVRESLLHLQREIVDALLSCRFRTEENVQMLLQQFYLAMIEEHILSRNYNEASDLVFEAFDNVPPNLQKPLWKWRVVVLSKKGKNVLDAIQKLKEGDASLQARVYAILARSSSNPKQQLEAYKKTIEILKEDMERVDYSLETAQWMASAGVPRVEILEVVQSGLDCLYEVEEKKIAVPLADDDDHSMLSSQSGASSRRSARKSTGGPGGGRGPTLVGTPRVGGGASRGGGGGGSTSGRSKRSSRASSVKGGGEPEPGMPDELSIKHLEQGVRSLVMLAMLTSDALQRQERCLEAVYFVKQFFALWNTTMIFAAKCDSYYKLSSAERLETSFDAYLTPETAMLDLVIPLEDPVALLCWTPSANFVRLLAVAGEQPQGGRGVPSVNTMQNMPLTLHYAMWLARTLDMLGFPKHALVILGWVRAIVCALPKLETRESVFAMVHYRAANVMMRCGLSDLVPSLPTALGNTKCSCFEYLRKIGSKLLDPAAVMKREIIESEELTVFGFSSWTQALFGIDDQLCALEICQDLLALGQVSQCRALAGIIHRDFLVKQDKRSLLQVTGLLAELDLADGKIAEVLSSALLSRSDMMEAGDANLLAKHVEVLVAAYLRSGQPDEARRVSRDAIAALTTFASLQISKDIGNKAHVGTGVGSRVGDHSVSSVGTSVGRIGTAITSKVIAVAQFESSLEVCEALASVVFAYVDLLLVEALSGAYDGKDPRSQFVEIQNCLSSVHDTAVAVSGATSALVAQVLESKFRSAVTLLTTMHTFVAIPSLAAGEYSDWLKKSYQAAIQALERCVDIRRGLLSRISLEQQSYVPSLPPKKAVEEVVDPKAKKAAPKAAEPILVEVKEPEPRLLSVPLTRSAAFAELMLAEQSMLYGRLCGDHLTVAPLEPAQDPSVIEAYLQDTTQPLPFKKEDFVVPPIIRSTHLASSAAQALANTDYEPFASLLYTNSNVMRLCGSGAFDATWRKPRPVFISKIVPAVNGVAEHTVQEEVPQRPIALDEGAVRTRSSLAAQVPIALAGRRYGQALLGCVSLVDAYGALGNGPMETVCWLFIMQSIRAREWLMQNWAAALTPNGEIASSVRRLEQLERARYPNAASQPQIKVELEFLAKTSPAWRRLEVNRDPAEILAKLPASTAVMCLQMCPSMSCMYACAGLPEVSGSAPVAPVKGTSVPEISPALPFTAKGLWKVVKMELPEPARRLILTLVQQHRKWREDATKFVAVYGENVSMEQDKVGVEAVYGSKVMKAERALQEALRALLSDLEQVLSPLFAEDAEFRVFLKSLSPSDANLRLLTFVDPSLQDLPWEGLSVSSLFGGQIGRDFSLHLLGHRLKTFERPVCDASMLRTVCDPFSDDSGSKLEGYERQAIQDIVGKLKVDGAAGAAKWASLKAGKGLLSSQDWISTIQSKGPKNVSLFVYTPGRLGSLLSPSDVSSLNFQNVLLFTCVDQGLNDASFRRQNSLDNTKTVQDIALESPLKLIANASLGGCGSLVVSLWATTLSSQQRAVGRFFGTFTKGGKNSIAALANANGLGVAVEGDPLQGVTIKPWIALSRVSFGLPVTYQDL